VPRQSRDRRQPSAPQPARRSKRRRQHDFFVAAVGQFVSLSVLIPTPSKRKIISEVALVCGRLTDLEFATVGQEGGAAALRKFGPKNALEGMPWRASGGPCSGYALARHEARKSVGRRRPRKPHRRRADRDFGAESGGSSCPAAYAPTQPAKPPRAARKLPDFLQSPTAGDHQQGRTYSMAGQSRENQ
jgi:hypothetical protein